MRTPTFKVLRRQEVDGFPELVRVRRPWSEITTKERVAVGFKTAGKLAIIAAFAMGGKWMGGTSPQIVDRDTRIESGLDAATAKYRGMADVERYRAAYISPITVTEDNRVGGERVRRWFVSSEKTILTVGQACLKDTPFDTDAKEIEGRYADGQLSPGAGWSVDANDTTLKIYPVGSVAPALEFAMVGADLVPSAATINTLKAKGCVVDPANPALSVTAREERNGVPEDRVSTLAPLSIG